MKLLTNPLWLFFACFLFVVGLLSVPVVLPVGPMYWDLYLYLDAAQRIADGQAPAVDFSTPVGPLAYFLAAWGLQFFDAANPFLVIQWSYFWFTAPLMIVLTFHVMERSLGQAWLLFAPFVVLSLFASNLITVIPVTGVDGWGFYNRHAMQLLYVLTATITCARSERLLFALISVVMIALFFTKITAFLAGGLILFAFFLAGRIPLRVVFACSAMSLVVIVVLQVFTGVVSAYLLDIWLLVENNQGSIFHRFFSVAVNDFDVLIAGFFLCLLLFLRETWRESEDFDDRPRFEVLQGSIFDRESFLLAIAILAGWAFETQNSGSQQFIHLWPIVLPILFRSTHDRSEKAIFMRAATFGCIAFLIVPAVSVTLHKAARVIGASAVAKTIDHDNLGPLGLLSSRLRFEQNNDVMRDVYVNQPEAFHKIAASGIDPMFRIHAQPDFQILNLQEIDKAINAIRALEEMRDERFASVWLVDFSNPVGWLLNKRGPRLMPIGFEPARTALPIVGERFEALADTDLILVPKCPVTANRLKIFEQTKIAFSGHEKMMLTPCMDAYVKR